MTRGASTAWVGLAAVLGGASLFAAASLGRPVVLRLGPADHDYVEGFRRVWPRQIEGRWAKAEAAVELPFRVRRGSRVLLTGDRKGLPLAGIEVAQSGAPPRTWALGPAATYALELQPAASISLTLRSEAPQGGPSLRLRTVTVVPGAPGAVVPVTSALLRPSLSAALACAIFVAAGFSGPASLASAFGLLSLPLALLALADPLAAVHIGAKAALLMPALGAFILLLPRALARSAAHVLVLATVSRLAVFHPDYDFKDVHIHRELADVARREGPAELWRNMSYYQEKFDLGRAATAQTTDMRAFPYPPTFYTAVAYLPIAHTEDAMKVVGIAAESLAILLVIVLAGRLVAPGLPAAAAGLLAAFLPTDVREMLRAAFPAVLGHALDLGIATWLTCRWNALRSNRGCLLLAGTIAAAGLTYNAAPVHFALFLPLLLAVASWPPPLDGRLRLVLAAGLAGLACLLFYGPYLLLTLERAREAQSLAGPHVSWATRLAVAFNYSRVLGPLYPILAALGLLVVLPRHWPRAEGRVLAAWALFALAILVPVFLAPEPFRYFRAFYMVSPLLPVLVAGLGAAFRGMLAPTTLLLLGWSAYEISRFAGAFFPLAR